MALLGLFLQLLFNFTGRLFAALSPDLGPEQSPESIPLPEGHPPQGAPERFELHVPRRSQRCPGKYLGRIVGLASRLFS